jgi:hypothetical protein
MFSLAFGREGFEPARMVASDEDWSAKRHVLDETGAPEAHVPRNIDLLSATRRGRPRFRPADSITRR